MSILRNFQKLWPFMENEPGFPKTTSNVNFSHKIFIKTYRKLTNLNVSMVIIAF